MGRPYEQEFEWLLENQQPEPDEEQTEPETDDDPSDQLPRDGLLHRGSSVDRRAGRGGVLVPDLVNGFTAPESFQQHLSVIRI